MSQSELNDFATIKLFEIIEILANEPTVLVSMFNDGSACANDLEDLAEDLDMYFSGFSPDELGAELYELVRQIECLLSTNGGADNSKFWTLGALSSEKDWSEIRRYANACLTEIKAKLT